MAAADLHTLKSFCSPKADYSSKLQPYPNKQPMAPNLRLEAPELLSVPVEYGETHQRGSRGTWGATTRLEDWRIARAVPTIST